MRVKLFAVDDQGCGFYRILEPARALEGVEGLSIDSCNEIKAEVGLEDDGTLSHRLQQGDEHYPCDVVVFQRPALRRMVTYIEEFQAKGIAVVVELDDDVAAVASMPHHPSYHAYRGEIDSEHHGKYVHQACRMADLVTVTTDALAERYAPHGRYAILPNCIPERVLAMPHLGDGHTIGYTGAIHFHTGDLQVTYGGVQMALDACPDWRFLKVGGGAELCQKWLNLKDRPDQTGPLPIGDFHEAVPMLDVGIVPLAPSTFNAAKSYLKGLEYAACGIPFIASSVRDYEKLHDQHGVGILCPDRGRNWKSKCRLLMENEQARVEESERGLEWARTQTIEGNAWRWAEAWALAIENRRRNG